MKYAVTAATGHLGQTIIKTLTQLVSPSDIIAIARNTDKAHQVLPAGVEIRQGDYTDIDSLKTAFTGVDRLLFISSIPGTAVPRQTQHANVVEAAKAADVRYIAYTSFAKADTAKSPLSTDHVATEKMIVDSGIAHSFLRNAWYLENEANYLTAGAAGKDMLYAAGDGRVSYALEREYAEAGAKVLAATSTKAIYEFGGQPTSFQDLAQAIHQVTGKTFTFTNVSTADYKQSLIDNGVNVQLADVLTSMQNLMGSGELDVSSSDLADVLGHPVTPLNEAVKEVLSKLQ